MIKTSDAHMTKSRSTGHDGGFVDGHSIFGVVGHNSMARFMVGSNGLVLLVDFHTPALRAWSKFKGRAMEVKVEKQI